MFCSIIRNIVHYSGAALSTWKGKKKPVLLRINLAPTSIFGDENHYRYRLLIS